MSAELRNGQHILELGCGWGFLTLWMAAHFANRQREYIQQQAKLRGLDNRPVTSTIWP